MSRETVYDEGTAPEVRAILESLMYTRRRVRVFLGDRNTGECWGDNWYVTGRIGCSTGSKPIVLLCANARSMGGGGLLTACIVRMLVDGREVYRHAGYLPPVYTWTNDEPEGLPVRVIEIKRDGKRETVAQFATMAKANRWMDFMSGERMSQ